MKKTRKLVAFCLVGITVLSFTACGKAEKDNESKPPVGNAKTGYAVISEIKEDEYSPSDTALEINSVCVAVLTDSDNKVLALKLDEAQIKPNLKNDNGNVADLRTKREKLDDYGMKDTSAQIGIGKEWYEQAAEFEKWAVGKTAEQISAGADKSGKATDADLKAGCTINVSSFIKATVEAIGNAKELGAAAGDTLKLNIDAEKYYESNESNLQYDCNYCVVTLDNNGKITSCLIDASQAKCSIENGKFTVEKGAYKTKKELGDAYGMKDISAQIGIGKEWYEQAAAIEEWSIGKTAAEIANTYGTDMKTTDADLKAGCTITVNSIIDCLADASKV